MKAFLLTMAVVGAWEVVATLVNLANRNTPERTPGGMAFNAVVMGGIAMWAAYLLVGGAQ